MMVVTVPTPMVEIIDDVRTDWVREYRRGQAAADQWAIGLGHVSHSIETQERVFRMAEQLQRRGVDRTDLFTALEEADRRIALSGDPHAAAEAGQLAIAYKVFRCWVSEFQALPDLDANANAVAIQHLKLENEGWVRDVEVAEPAEPTFTEPA